MGKRNAKGTSVSKTSKRISGKRKGRVKSRRGIYVGRSARHDRAVFAGRSFETGETIERAPVIVLPKGEQQSLDETGLYGYVFEWWDGDVALAFGFGSFYNHSVEPSADYELYEEDRVVRFVARRPIAKDEEITISYGEAADLWFDPVEV